jgi:uncharacterized protein (TIGR04255 family)
MVSSKPLLHPPLTEVAFEISFPRQFIVENRIAEFQQALSTSYPVSSDEFSIRMPPAVAFGKLRVPAQCSSHQCGLLFSRIRSQPAR